MSVTRHTLATASAVLLIATLAACGGGGDPEATDAGPQGSAPDIRGGGPGGTPPGASGEVADVTGRTAQVQGPNGQVAVTWTGGTTFTEEVEATLADVTVGSCVMVTGADEDTDPEATEVTAASVRVEEPADDGGCGFAAGGPDGAPSFQPEGTPSDLPSGAPDGVRRGFGTAGTVSAVAADGFSVTSQRPDEEDPVEVTVTADDDTTVTTTAAAKASAVEVGRCVVAQGGTDDTGAVTATSISVSDPVDGECLGGLLTVTRPDGGAA
ncbi:hypothetical protein HZF07_00785 [Nocardioides sp. CGMCC 1.13656]|uniref:hypothetical protein n=1 Tax=Nocardioides TaxID=1839 RepID=UPI0012FAAF17|nr:MULTISPECIES: hypothetical protein [unclassified Nocardioides]MBA2952227.1 hypothetical protein [Nocardioides sp. CGMCC 1.13656]